MAMAAGAMAGGTSPPSPLRSPAPSLRSTTPSLCSPAPHLHSPSPPIRSPFPAASIPSGEVSGAAATRGGRGGVRALLSAVKVTDPAALAAMEGLNPRRGQGSCSTPEMGHQEASNGGETRLADTSSTAARSPASSSRTQQHLGSGVLAGKKPQESGEACGEPQRSSDARGEQRATSETRMEQRDGSKVPRSLPTSNKRSKKPQESSEACAEPQRSSETCMEQRDGSEVPRSLLASNKRSKKVPIENSEKTSLTTGRKRPLSDASGSLRARKAAKVINAKVDKTKLQTSSKTVRKKVAQIVSSSPMMNIIARRRVQSNSPRSYATNARSPKATNAKSPKTTTSLKSPSLHDLSPAATTGAPNSMHDLSPAATTGAPNSMHDRSPIDTNGSKHRPRKLRSVIWNDAEPIYIGGFLMQGRCKYCNSVFPASKVSGTSQLARHLKVCEVKSSMDGVIEKIRTSEEIDPDWRFDQKSARSKLVELIVLHGLPFSFVEYAGFRKFCASLNPWFKLVNRVTIQNDCKEAYHLCKTSYEDFFKNCNYRVSLTGDMWTSNQKLGYLCITCHWIDNKWKVGHRIIRFCLVETPHDAWNMFGVVLDSLRDWNIEDKLFSFTMDNAEVNEEWKMVEDICQLLKVFYHATNVISGSNYPTSNLYFLEIWGVKIVLDEQEKSENATIRVMVKEMKKKFHKYFMESYLTNCVPLVFDPRFKMEHVEFRLKQYFGVEAANKHITEVKEAIAALFIAYATEFVDNGNSSSQERNNEEVVLADSALSDWHEHVKIKEATSRCELQRYLEEGFHPCTPDFDILQWWAVNSARYPILGNIARDVLAVPASSVASESAFSTCGRVITDHRTSLGPKTVEALMCYGDWIKHDGSFLQTSTPHE